MMMPASGLFCSCICLLLAIVQNPNGQEKDLPAPHERLSQGDEYKATELTQLRAWALRDGAEFKGKLLKWTSVDGVALFRDQFGRPAYYPLRQFDEGTQAELTSLLESAAKEFKYIRTLRPIPIGESFKAKDDKIPPGSLPVDYREGYVYWMNNGQCYRSPDSLFDVSLVDEIRKAIDALAKYQTWEMTYSPFTVRAQLIGVSDDALVMRGLEFTGKMVDEIEYLVPLSSLVEQDQQRAAKLLAAMPGGGKIPVEKVPQWWLGLEKYPGLPIRPTAIEGMQVKVVQPDFRQLLNSPAGTKWTNKTMDWQTSISSLAGDSELFVRSLIEKDRLLKENPQLSKDELGKRIESFRSGIIDANPIQVISPISNWSFRECQLGISIAARVVAERGDYFIFKGESSDTTFWILKSEVPESLQAYCTSTAKKLADYFKARPDIQPKLDSKFRLIRNYEYGCGMQMIGQPVQITNGRIELLGLAPDGTTPKMMLNAARIHSVDLLELKMVLSGKDTASDKESMSVTDRRANELMERLRSLEERSDTWRIVSKGEEAGFQNTFGFRGAVIRRFQDSFIFRENGKEFLVDSDLLFDEERAKANNAATKLAELRAATKVKIDENAKPQSRLWGTSPTPIIGFNPQFKPDGRLTYTELYGSEQTISARDLRPSLIAEIRTQIEADKQIRSSKSELNADELRQLAELKERVRKESLANAKATAIKHFSLKDSAIAASGTFEQFDGEDAILRDEQGNFVRVFRFALKDESIAMMTTIEENLKAQGKTSQTAGLNPANVTLRLFRGAKSSAFLPGTPLRCDSRNLYVQYASGGYGRHGVDKIHPEDMAAIRSNLYLAAHGLERDTGINERLKRPVKPEEVIIAKAELADKWKQRLDKLAEPRALIWESKKIALGSESDVIAISPDGSHVLVGGGQLNVVNVADGKSVKIDSQVKTLHSAFIANDNQSVVGFDGKNLKRWDTATGKLTEQFDAVETAPIAWCQSADSYRILLLVDAKQLYVYDMKSGELQRMRFGDDSQLAVRPALWCSANGDRFIARSGKSLQVFAWDKAETTYKPDYPIESPFENVSVAFGQELILITDKQAVNISAVGRLNGRFSVSEIATGLYPEWLGIEEVDGEEMIHVIGKRGDPISQAAPYMFSAYIGLDQRVARSAQTIDVASGSPILIAATGRSAVVKSDAGWELASAGPLSESQFKPLDAISRDLIDETDVGQIDAAWEYLRGAPFQRIGEYPDQASEVFLEYMGLHVALHKWQHGGDMKERANLLLDRWRKMAPKSMFVPTLAAIHQRRLAWEARGSGFADTVTAEGAKIFEEKMLAVAALLKPIFLLEHPPTRAYTIAYDVAMSLGLPSSVTKNLNASMMKTPVRSSTPAHAAVVLSLLPRWHGQPGDSERYITAIANTLGGDEGDSLYASLMLYAANYYPSEEPASNYLEYDPERVLKGLQVFYRAPNSSENFQRALKMFAGEERWDLYKRAMQLRTEERIFQDDTSKKTLEVRIQHEQRALSEK